MEIEVNEYVRTRAGHFYKMTRIDENGLIYWNKIQCGWSMEQLKDIVVKHSKNIIDLVEVGDYVNGHLVVEISKNAYNQKLVITEVDGKDGAIRHHYLERSIKNVVTHEQFESIKYKVETEDK